MSAISTSNVLWIPCYRIVSTTYPPINFFESVSSDPTEWELLVEVERLTDPSFSIGDLSVLEVEDRLSGKGAGRILPSFTFRDPKGTRFSTQFFGAYYATLTLETAILETIYHRTVFMRATQEPAQDLDQVVILADLNGKLEDLRHSKLKDIYHPKDYAKSQLIATELRAGGSLGIVYDSVRHPGGQCAAIWRSRVLSKAREDKHITYRWNGEKITGYFNKSGYRPVISTSPES